MSLPLSILHRPDAREAAAATARGHCETCPHAQAIYEVGTNCALRTDGKVVRHVGDACGAGYFDHRLEASKRVCREQITEEWDAEWQAKLLAQAHSVGDRCVFIGRSLYTLALQHRR